MAVTINDGWLTGTLPDDTGREWPVSQSRQLPTGAQHGFPVNLVLHTTETDNLIPKLQFPSNFQCGEGKIVQHIQLGQSGDAVFTFDRDNIGIEMVGRSRLARWLPSESTLGPTVALVAWLHASERIQTGLKRPNPDWPVVLDRGPQASKTYYRRTDGTWDKPGVYGHVEVPDNDHWDPGSFDYPVFFGRVQQAIDGGDMADPRVDALIAGLKDYVDDTPPAADAPPNEKRMYQALKDAAQKPVVTATGGLTVSQGDLRYAQKAHGHTGSVSVT